MNQCWKRAAIAENLIHIPDSKSLKELRDTKYNKKCITWCCRWSMTNSLLTLLYIVFKTKYQKEGLLLLVFLYVGKVFILKYIARRKEKLSKDENTLYWLIIRFPYFWLNNFTRFLLIHFHCNKKIQDFLEF